MVSVESSRPGVTIGWRSLLCPGSLGSRLGLTESACDEGAEEKGDGTELENMDGPDVGEAVSVPDSAPAD